eukprot:RCo002599
MMRSASSLASRALVSSASRSRLAARAPTFAQRREIAITAGTVVGAVAGACLAWNVGVVGMHHIHSTLNVFTWDYVQDRVLWNIYSYVMLFTLLITMGILFVE